MARKKSVKPKKVLSSPLGNMSGKPTPTGGDDRKAPPKIASGVVGTAEVGRTRTPIIDENVERVEKIRAQMKKADPESVVFEGCGSFMVPIPKIVNFVEDGQLQEKVIVGKQMISFGSESNFQYKTNDPGLIKGLREMGFKEV